METITFRITGEGPIMMHSSRLANPLDPQAQALKALTAKRGKLEEDHKLIARTEWEAGMYHDPEIGPYIPDTNAIAMLVEGGKSRKLGKAVTRGIVVQTTKLKLEYSGPRDIERMWASGKFHSYMSVRNQANRVMRSRSIFEDWSFTLPLYVDTDAIEVFDIAGILEYAGKFVGLGDFRPTFGKFRSEQV